MALQEELDSCVYGQNLYRPKESQFSCKEKLILNTKVRSKRVETKGSLIPFEKFINLKYESDLTLVFTDTKVPNIPCFFQIPQKRKERKIKQLSFQKKKTFRKVLILFKGLLYELIYKIAKIFP